MIAIVLHVVFMQHSNFGDFWVAPCTTIYW